MKEANPLHAELAACLNVGHGAIARAVKNLSHDQLVAIPEGFRNNVLWNLGHLPVVLSAVVCAPAEMEPVAPKHFEPLFKNGSSPAHWNEAPDVQEVLDVFNAATPKVANALLAGELDHFVAIDLFKGYTIGSAEHALTFHSFHTGIHLGMINSLKKFL